MIFGSVCSGIEAASAAWESLGWRCAFVSEVEPFPNAVLAHHYPNVPNFGDMTYFEEWPDAAIDLLVGGTPCQSFSVAGKREGLDDPRGNLTFVYLAVARRYRPRWLVWENVPGVLSIDGGRAFGAFLGGLAELGYGFAYRVLDAQYFGVPQRRRRVFVVGHLGDWRRAAAVLLERRGLSGDSPPRREAGEDIAGILAAHTRGGSGLGIDSNLDGGLVTSLNDLGGVSHALTARPSAIGRHDPNAETLITFDETQITSPQNRNYPMPGDSSHPLTAGARPPTIAFTENSIGGDASPTLLAECGKETASLNAMNHPCVSITIPLAMHARQDSFACGPVSPPLDTDPGTVAMIVNGVRRLTPRECERLQGFTDDWTLISYRGKPAADGPRYRALGNSMAVPVMRWIGERIELCGGLE